MRKQETKQSIMSSTSAFWLPVPLQKGLAGLNSRAWWDREGHRSLQVIQKHISSDMHSSTTVTSNNSVLCLCVCVCVCALCGWLKCYFIYVDYFYMCFLSHLFNIFYVLLWSTLSLPAHEMCNTNKIDWLIDSSHSFSIREHWPAFYAVKCTTQYIHWSQYFKKSFKKDSYQKYFFMLCVYYANK